MDCRELVGGGGSPCRRNTCRTQAHLVTVRDDKRTERRQPVSERIEDSGELPSRRFGCQVGRFDGRSIMNDKD
jgi:hypothetical protein